MRGLRRRSLSRRSLRRASLRRSLRRSQRMRGRRRRRQLHDPVLCLHGMIIYIVAVDLRCVVVIKDKVGIIPFIIPFGTIVKDRAATALAEALWHGWWRDHVVLDIHRMVILVMIVDHRCIVAVKLDIGAVATIVTGGPFNEGNSAAFGRFSRIFDHSRLSMVMVVRGANVRASIIALPEAWRRMRVEDRGRVEDGGRMDDSVFDINRVVILVGVLDT
jgi:hypothetical protein